MNTLSARVKTPNKRREGGRDRWKEGKEGKKERRERRNGGREEGRER